MAKKRPNPKQRTDAERRARQCERLSRLLRVLHCITGPGRWDAQALARELEVSQRTVHRIMQTLSMANIPWYFDEEVRAYRLRPGFRFPLGEFAVGPKHSELYPDNLETIVERLVTDAEELIRGLNQLRGALQQVKR